MLLAVAVAPLPFMLTISRFRKSIVDYTSIIIIFEEKALALMLVYRRTIQGTHKELRKY